MAHYHDIQSFTSRLQLPSLLFLALLLGIVNCSGGANHTDELALMAIKSQITHDPQGILGTWNTSLHFCQWEGVMCGRRHTRVVVLDLRSRGLVGSLSPHIGNLSFLRYLSLHNNTLSGGIPPEIGRLFRLWSLFLVNNSFEGEIPSSLSNCTNMRALWLYGNKLVGKLPNGLSSLVKLVELVIERNYITGVVPLNIGNLTSLELLYVGQNSLRGTIPHSLGNLKNMDRLGLGSLKLSGTIPSSFYNLSSLVILDLSDNEIGGELSKDIGLKLPRLEELLISSNQFTGSLPPSISNFSNLVRFQLKSNKFFGKVGFSFGNLANLEDLILSENNIGSGELDDMNLIDSFVNCSKLRRLALAGTKLTGVLPNSIGNLSTQLSHLYLDENFIYGPIPSTIGNLVGLEVLNLFNNQLTSSIPSTLGKLVKLQQISLVDNVLTGKIPNSIGNLSLVNIIFFDNNRLEQTIPPEIGHCQSLIELSLSTNNLVGHIPQKLFELSSLSIALDLSHNHLDGPLPQEIRNLKMLTSLDVSYNRLEGEIPNSIGSCISLQYLYLQENKFQGSLPPSFSVLKGIQWLDLSINNFSRQIPHFLEKLNLSYLNLSFNNFEGEVPMEGVFINTSAVAIVGNRMLCGGVSELRLPKCLFMKPKKGNRLSVVIIVTISLFSLLGFGAMASYFLFIYRKRKGQPQLTEAPTMQSLSRVSYGSLFKATNEFNERNIIGRGNFSSVYKGILEPDGKIIAIKVLQLGKHGASKSFMAECEALKNIRHRNLLKIVTSCSSVDFQGNDFKALVYEFMPNGNLESWLHPSPENQIDTAEAPQRLSLHQRLAIAKDVAHAIHYLHQDCEVPIIHCDLKPTNILLDSDMVACIGDFGLAKFLPLKPHQSSSIGIRGTVGYAAPEYGLGSEMTKEGDIYSFGIFLLEMITGKRPTDLIFQEDLNLHGYVKMALPHHLMEIIEPSILPVHDEEIVVAEINDEYRKVEGRKWERVEEVLISLATIGLGCSMEDPRERIDTSKVIHELHRMNGVLAAMFNQV